jgi:putative NIF3 family GTP cyclohydrolase 1 type 2
VVPGSGADFIDPALAAGADLLVTGDVSHHRARYAADSGLGLIDPGHARTERPGVARLLELVAGVAPEVTDLTGLDPSPWEPVQ